MGNFIQSFDFLSPPISLYYKGKLRHSSIFSGLISLISLFSIIYLSYFFSKDLIYKINPTAYYYNKFIENINPVFLDSSGLFHMINLNYGTSELEFNRLFNIIGVENHLRYFNFSNLISFSHYIYDYCDEKDIYGIEDTFKFILDFKNLIFCIKKYYNNSTQKIYNLYKKEYPYPSLIYGNSAPIPSKYGILIQKCKNSSINNNCYSQEIIDSEIKKFVGYSIEFLDHNILIDNYQNLDLKINNKIGNQFNLGVGYTTNHLNFKPLLVKTNDGIIFNNEKIHHSYKFDFNEKLTTLFSEEENPNYDILTSIYFWMQNQEDIYVRSYKKISDVLGCIAGIMKIIILISERFNLLIHRYTYLNDINKDIVSQYKKQYLDISSSIICNNNNNSSIKLKEKKITAIINKKNLSKLSEDKSKISLNNYLNGDSIKNKRNKKIRIQWKNENIGFLRILNNMFFLKRDFYIQKLDEFKQCIISEERMFKNYFLIKSLKGYVFDFNSKKGFDFFNGEEISGSSVLNNLNFINNVKIKNMNND